MATFLNESNFNGRNGTYFKLILEYDKVMHTDTNSHDVTYYLYFQSLSGYSGSGSANSVKGQINGVQVGTASSIGVNQKLLLGQKTVNVPHNEDGTGSVLYSALIDTTWTLGDASVTGKLTLPTIKRASTWNMTNLQMSNIEDTLVLKINKYVTGYTDKVVISSADGNTVVKTINNASNNQQITFTSGELTTLYTLDSNETLTNLKFLMTLSTYDGTGNLVGDAQKITMSAYLLNANPTFTYTIVETEAKVIDLLDRSDASTIIKSFSKPKITVTASASKGATIKTISIVNGTQANANANPYIFNNVQTGTFTIVVTDSRNLTRTEVVPKNLIDYTPVYINSYSFERESQTSSNILLNADITCYSGSFNSITNIPTVMYKMGASGTYQEITSGFTFSNNKIIFNNYSLGEILPYTQTNRFYLYVLDLLTEDTENEIVSKGVATVEAGEHDFQVNGTLYLADENRENKRPLNLSGEGSKMYKPNDNGVFEQFFPSVYRGVTNNLNNATKEGYYTYYNEATNKPFGGSSSWGCVITNYNNGWIFQTAYATYDVNNSRIAHRGYINNAWTEWSQVPTKSYVEKMKTYQYAYKSFTRVTGNLATGSWVTMCTDLSVTLPVGEYMLIFCPAVTGNASGLTTFNPVIDGTRTSSVTRQTIPIASSLVTNAQCIVPLTVATQKAYTFNVQQYANASSSVSAVGLYIYKLN